MGNLTFKTSSIFFIAVALQILSTQGILWFNIFKPLGIWEFKKAIHPLSTLLVFLYFIFYRMSKGTVRFSQVELTFFVYLLVLFIPYLFSWPSPSSIYYVFRDIYLIFILVYIYYQSDFSTQYWNRIYTLIFVLVVANIFFTLLVYFMPFKKYVALLYGEYAWGVHPEYNFKFSNFGKLYRVPALIGDSNSVGNFGLFSYFLLRLSTRYKKWAWVSIILIAFSFTRSVYLIFAVYLFLTFFMNKSRFKYLIYLSPILPLILLYAYFKNLFNLASLQMRFDLWANQLKEIDFNWVFGGAMGEVGSALDNDSFSAILDSYWLLMLFSTGIIGIILLILFIAEKCSRNSNLSYFCIAFAIGGLLVTLTQSLVFVSMFPLLFLNYTIIQKENALAKE